MQMAWDRLTEVLGTPSGIKAVGSHGRETIAALNRGRLPTGVIDPKELTIVSGPATTARLQAIEDLSQQTRTGQARRLTPQDVVVYAKHEARARFKVPFYACQRPLHFGSNRIEVRAWGLRRSVHGSIPNKMRSQVRIHVPQDTDVERADQHVVTVIRAENGKKVVVSGRPPRASLNETWLDVARVMATTETFTPSLMTQVFIPRVSIDAAKKYDELIGAGINDGHYSIQNAEQRVLLYVDEGGANVYAESRLLGVGGLPDVRRVCIEGPFLIAVIQPNCDLPFVLAWVGNKSGLIAWDTPLQNPLKSVEVRSLVGRWTFDREQSLAATLKLREDTYGTGAIQVRGYGRKHPRNEFQEFAFEINIHKGALVALSIREVKIPNAKLAREGTTFVLNVPKHEDARATKWEVSREGSFLQLLNHGRGEVLLLSRDLSSPKER